MAVKVTGTLTDAASFGRAIAEFGRRSMAQQLRRQGELAGQMAVDMAFAELGPPRSGNRHRGGPHYHTGFRVEYSGLEAFVDGNMTVSVRNLAKHAAWIEEGSPGSTISANGDYPLRWPGKPYATPGPPWAVVTRATVTNPGFEGHHILERSATTAIMQRIAGRTYSHATVRVSSR